MLAMWSIQLPRGELFALSTGKVPRTVECEKWKRLRGGVERTEAAISKITTETPSAILSDMERQDYHLLERRYLREDWKRPADA